MNVREVLKQYPRAVAIVHYRAFDEVHRSVYNGGHPPQNPACNLQITLLADKVSRSGKFMRLGETAGDEVVGWTNIDALEVVEILGILQPDSKTVVPL